MTHFTTYVILPSTLSRVHAEEADESGRVGGRIEDALNAMLEPYSENLDVPEYQTRCYCVGSEAVGRTRIQVERQFTTYRERRRAELLGPELAELLEDRSDEPTQEQMDRVEEVATQLQMESKTLWNKILEEQPDKDLANPDCSTCGGSGIRITNYNPKSTWDWWVIGGRWSGLIQGQERDQLSLSDLSDLVWNMAPASELAARPDFDWVPYAIVTPDGTWHQRGETGWWGISQNEMAPSAWCDKARELMQQNAENWVVGLDLHI